MGTAVVSGASLCTDANTGLPRHNILHLQQSFATAQQQGWIAGGLIVIAFGAGLGIILVALEGRRT
jgi:hypothetical protein